jgi:hypothetical protein
MAQSKSTPSNDFQIVDADAITFVKRGRKANADPALIDALKTLPAGKAMRIASMQQDPKAATYATDKARVASTLRTACKAANLVGFRIMWSPDGVPQVVR